MTELPDELRQLSRRCAYGDLYGVPILDYALQHWQDYDTLSAFLISVVEQLAREWRLCEKTARNAAMYAPLIPVFPVTKESLGVVIAQQRDIGKEIGREERRQEVMALKARIAELEEGTK